MNADALNNFTNDYETNLEEEEILSHENLERSALVLVVDDQVPNLQVIGNLLHDEGYEVSLAESGKRALEILKEVNPDLILLDIMMPEMSGFDVIKEIKNDELTADIPVMFLTAREDTESVVQGFQLGGNDYVSKPYRKEELLARIKTHILLKKQRIELSELNATKDRLISIIGHDLKNPIYGILSLVDDYLSEEQTNEERQEIIRLIKKAAGSAELILMDILEWSRLVSGRHKAKYQSIQVSELLENAIHENEEIARLKDIQLQIERCPLDAYLNIDYYMLQAALRNLISNAVKFSHRNSDIELGSLIEEGEGGEQLTLYVRDHGVGMDKERRESLFAIDKVISYHGTEGERGTGFGLILTKEFIEKNGGKLAVQSAPNEGTIFYMHFPVES